MRKRGSQASRMPPIRFAGNWPKDLPRKPNLDNRDSIDRVGAYCSGRFGSDLRIVSSPLVPLDLAGLIFRRMWEFRCTVTDVRRTLSCKLFIRLYAKDFLPSGSERKPPNGYGRLQIGFRRWKGCKTILTGERICMIPTRLAALVPSVQKSSVETFKC